MNKRIVLILLTISFIFTIGCQNKDAKKDEELVIFAASSLNNALSEVVSLYNEKNKNIDIKLNFAASGTLQKQIEEGAPADIFISAGVRQMDILQEKELIDYNSRRNLLKNKLVIIAAKSMDNKINVMNDLTKPYVTKISIGTPEIAPVGKYAKESLVNLKLWESIKDKLVLGKNVRQVLSYVETENVDVGIVYKSDTKILKNSITVLTIPDDFHSPIVYPLAVIKDSKNKRESNEFISFLRSNDAVKVFNKYGFTSFK